MCCPLPLKVLCRQEQNGIKTVISDSYVVWLLGQLTNRPIKAWAKSSLCHLAVSQVIYFVGTRILLLSETGNKWRFGQNLGSLFKHGSAKFGDSDKKNPRNTFLWQLLEKKFLTQKKIFFRIFWKWLELTKEGFDRKCFGISGIRTSPSEDSDLFYQPISQLSSHSKTAIMTPLPRLTLAGKIIKRLDLESWRDIFFSLVRSSLGKTDEILQPASL